MYRSAATHTAKKTNRRDFRVWNSVGQLRGHVTMATPDAAFSAARFCSYAVRRIEYDWPSWRQLAYACYKAIAYSALHTLSA